MGFVEQGEKSADAGIEIKAVINGHCLAPDAKTQVDLWIILHGSPRVDFLKVVVEKREDTEIGKTGRPVLIGRRSPNRDIAGR